MWMVQTTFAGFISLEGDAGVNEFEFGASGSLDGNINGGAGADEVDISAIGGPHTVDLTALTSQISGGILDGTLTDIETFTGDDTADILISLGSFNINGANSGNVNGAPFARVHQSHG